MRWMKPGAGSSAPNMQKASHMRQFVVETHSQKLTVPIEAANEMDGAIVKSKTRAATKWVDSANDHVQEIWRRAVGLRL
jgi:hypothetical protein